MNKWDVVLILYPFTDMTVLKLRPAVVISPDAFHNGGPDVTVAAITTKTDNLSQYGLLIPADHTEFAGTGLAAPSAARLEKIYTLDKSLMHSTIGAFGPQLQGATVQRLRSFFGI